MDLTKGSARAHIPCAFPACLARKPHGCYVLAMRELLKKPNSGASRRRLFNAILAIPTYCSGLRFVPHPD
jgi:hypothetical protein